MSRVSGGGRDACERSGTGKGKAGEEEGAWEQERVGNGQEPAIAGSEMSVCASMRVQSASAFPALSLRVQVEIIRQSRDHAM